MICLYFTLFIPLFPPETPLYPYTFTQVYPIIYKGLAVRGELRPLGLWHTTRLMKLTCGAKLIANSQLSYTHTPFIVVF